MSNTTRKAALAVAGLLNVIIAGAHDGIDPRPEELRADLAPLECGDFRGSSTGSNIGPARGVWLAGDTHVHDDHSSDGSLPRQTSKQTLPGNLPVGDQLGQAERIGLDFVPLTDHRTYDQHWDPQYGSDKLLLIPGEEANGSPHAIVLGASDVIVDGANPAGSAAFRHVQQSVWDAHAQGAVWQVAHPDDGETSAGVVNDNASVIGANAVEIFNAPSDPDAEIDYAENRWNRGFRFGVSGASDDHFREFWNIDSPGMPTTWVFAADRSVQAILDAMRAGHTTVSNSPSGPFVTLQASPAGGRGSDDLFDAMGGDEIQAHPGSKVILDVHIKNGAGTSVYVFASPGRSAGPLAVFTPTTTDQTFLLPVSIPAGASWYRVEVRSPGALAGLDSNPNLPDQLRAATSPIFFSTGAKAEPVPEIALPAPSGQDDHARFVAGSRACVAVFPDITSTKRGAHVVAEAHVEGRITVVYQRIDNQGRDDRDSPLFDLTPDAATARFPRIAVAGRHVWVVWEQERLGGINTSAIFLRHSSDGGVHWSRASQLSDGSSRANHPAIALLTENHPVVAWSDKGDGPYDVRTQIIGIDPAPVNISLTGKTIDPGNAQDARSPRFPASLFPSIAVSGKGTVAIAWQDDRFDPDPLWTGHTPPAGQPASGGTDPDNWDILVSLRSGDSWQPPIRVTVNDNAADRHPSIVADKNGGFSVAWDTSSLQSSGVNLSIRASRSADGGQTWSAPVAIAQEPTAMSERPRLDVDDDGSLRAVWYDSRSADWRWRVLTAKLLPDGAAWSPATALTSRGNATWPALSHGAVVFTSDRQAARVQRDPTEGIFLIHADRADRP
jgi:hypothetical protein